MKLSSRHRRTLAAVFKEPTSGTLPWNDAERLLKALGAELSEGRGSRVRIHLNGVRAVFHRPHSRKEAGRGLVRSLKRYLREAGIESKQ